MTATIALHGGAEFQAGDEAFLAALLERRRRPAERRAIRVAIVPTAAARGRPDLAGRHGVEAFERVAAAAGLTISPEIVPIVDAGSAADRQLAEHLVAADIIHLPGGDPDLIPAILADSVALAAIRTALESDVVLAGASAGAMAFAHWTWTSSGGTAGLALVPGPPFVVMPHADAGSWARARVRFGTGLPGGLGVLGLAERTGVLIEVDGGSQEAGHDAAPWLVAGEGEVRWSPAGSDMERPLVYRSGEHVRT